MKVTVLGDGAWGTALACLLADKGYHVTLWCYSADVAHTISSTGYNERYFPQVKCAGVNVTTSLQEALADTPWVFEAIPVLYMRSVVQKAQPYGTADQTWVVLSKGIEKDYHHVPTAIIHDVLGSHVSTVVVSGPSYARDLAHKKPTGLVVAAHHADRAALCARMLATEYLTLEMSSDPLGVQLCAALKNVIALGTGLLDGAGYTDNTKALLVTRGLQEIEQLVVKLGGQRSTVYGLAGVGDLVLTCAGSLSKNGALGRQLGSGQSLEAIVRERGGVMPEGVNTVQSVHQLAREHNVVLPLCSAIHDVVINGQNVNALVAALMA